MVCRISMAPCRDPALAQWRQPADWVSIHLRQERGDMGSSASDAGLPVSAKPRGDAALAVRLPTGRLMQSAEL